VAQKPFTVAHPAGQIDVSVSIGCAAASGEDEKPENLLRRSDDALYRAKRAGRNCVVVAEPARAPQSPVIAAAG
jgi:two-component system cell cycle response regulator